MIAYGRVADHYAHSNDFQALLAGCRAAPDDATARLVLADWLDDWVGGPSYPEGCAKRHAAFIRAQVDSEYAPGRRVLKSLFGSSAPACMKVTIDELVHAEPWLGTPAAAVVNSVGTGVFYRLGLPVALKCAPDNMPRMAELVKLWRIPDVYIRVGAHEMGIDPREGTLCWMNAPRKHRADHWVNIRDIPEDRSRELFVVETVLARAFGADCGGARFHAVTSRRWRSCHPVASAA